MLRHTPTLEVIKPRTHIKAFQETPKVMLGHTHLHLLKYLVTEQCTRTLTMTLRHAMPLTDSVTPKDPRHDTLTIL